MIDENLLKVWLEEQIASEVERLKTAGGDKSHLASMTVGAIDAYRTTINYLEGEYPDE